MSLIQVSAFGAGIHPDGALAGHPAVLVGVGTVDGDYTPMAAHDLLVLAEEAMGGPCLISIIGMGDQDAAIQPLDELIEAGSARGFRFAVEILGLEPPCWLEELDYLTIAPPPPSATDVTDFRALHLCMGAGLAGKPKLSILATVSDDADFAFAEMLHELFPPVDFYVAPAVATLTDDADHDIFDYCETARWIAETIIERGQPDMRLSLNVAALAGVTQSV